ncbi:MAG: hypothetical protein HY899_16755 [Deltaproteobacteria bacterium]|nr:hypothetical protein [Deltaproteobacteria bacterium]
MRSIKNLSAAPLRVPLPGGKTLHLGPGESGSIRDEAAEHPALHKLAEAGTLEVGASTPGTGVAQAGSGRGPGGGYAHGKSSAPRKSGDR